MRQSSAAVNALDRKRVFLSAFFAALLLFFCSACEKKGGDALPSQARPDAGSQALIPYTGDIVINTPKATGEVTFEDGGALIDASNTSDGYIMIMHEPTNEKLKVMVTKEDMKYTYDLSGGGEYEVYPLQMGNGAYDIKVLEQVEGTTYRTVCSAQLDVRMSDEKRVFVFPNQYVWYTNADDAIRLSFTLCQDINTDEEKMDGIYKYIISHIAYDQDKADKVLTGEVASGYLPDVDDTLSSGKGICFDYAALMSAMLRAQDIPTRLVIGNVAPENILHAWTQVYIDGKWVWMDPTFHNTGHHENDYTKQREY